MNYKSSLLTTLLAIAGISVSGSLYADSGYQVGVALGVLQGISVHAGYRFSDESRYLNKNFGTRIEYSTLNFTLNREEKSGRPSFEFFAKGNQIGGMIDYYPFAGNWVIGAIRFSTGFYAGKFEMGDRKSEDFKGIGKTVKFNNIDYLMTGRINLEAKLKSKATGPYLGTGFDMGLFYGLKLFGDVGLVFTEKPKITVSLSGPGAIEWNDETGHHQTGVSDLANSAEIKKATEDMAKNYEKNFKQVFRPFYPIAKLGLLYRF